MKKKMLTFGTLLFTVAVFAVLLVIVLTAIFPKKFNVFDELYYEVKKVRAGGESVLISGTESAYKKYDLGIFESIRIPDLNMSVSLKGESLNIHISCVADAPIWEFYESVHFRYDIRDKKLYGENTVAFLEKYFLRHYFAWRSGAGQANTFSLNDLGEYTFILQETVSRDAYYLDGG
ncbi:MAG: hypothetical protein IJZ14_00100 [Oscillospiraceae bacterium]|nr:hypothetical protein [Oscillospiraceae bacterium]MBQ8881462.1 hypothetical protein [Oscillospiraceae bacterium]